MVTPQRSPKLFISYGTLKDLLCHNVFYEPLQVSLLRNGIGHQQTAFVENAVVSLKKSITDFGVSNASASRRDKMFVSPYVSHSICFAMLCNTLHLNCLDPSKT